MSAIHAIVLTLNEEAHIACLTQRKSLGYITPLQVLFKDLGRNVKLRFA